MISFIKSIFTLTMLASSILLTACSDDSDSSSTNVTQSDIWATPYCMEYYNFSKRKNAVYISIDKPCSVNETQLSFDRFTLQCKKDKVASFNQGQDVYQVFVAGTEKDFDKVTEEVENALTGKESINDYFCRK